MKDSYFKIRIGKLSHSLFRKKQTICDICEEPLDLYDAVFIACADDKKLPEFKERGLMCCSKCYKREIAPAFGFKHKEGKSLS